MSASILEHRQQYLDLVEEFLAGKTGDDVFIQAFLAQRRSDLARDEAISKAWTRRYDLELLRARAAGELTPDEFSARWQGLWGYPASSPFLAFFEDLFSLVEAYEPDEQLFNLPDSGPDYYFQGEDELRRRVHALLMQLGASES